MKLNELAQSRARKAKETGWPWHRLRHGQDLDPRPEGPALALRVGDADLRRRPDAGLPAPAEARLQQHLQERNSHRSISIACRRPLMPAADPKKTVDLLRLRDAGLIGKRKDGVRLLARGELKTAITLEVDSA